LCHPPRGCWLLAQGWTKEMGLRAARPPSARRHKVGTYSNPSSVRLANRSRPAFASVLTRSEIRPTVRQAIRNSWQIAALDVFTASHAAVSSKVRVNPASCRAHGPRRPPPRAGGTPRAARPLPGSRTSCRDPAPAICGGPHPGHTPGSAAGNAGSDPAVCSPAGPRSRSHRPAPRPPRRPSSPTPATAPTHGRLRFACARRHRSFPTFLTVTSRNGRSGAACALLPGGRALAAPDLIATKRGTAAAVNQRETSANNWNASRAATMPAAG